MKYFMRLLVFSFAVNTIHAQDVTITIDASRDKQAVSPNIYGRNNTFDKPASFYKDAGVRFVRMNVPAGIKY